MKLVQGQTLFDLMAEPTELPEKRSEILSIFAFVCKAMAYTHSQNVIHLDLKPGNIMVGEFGEVHVMDWGLARQLFHSRFCRLPRPAAPANAKPSKRTSNKVHGTLCYMAPEQAKAEAVDKRTDVFCLGSMLCEILTGRLPTTPRGECECLNRPNKPI